MTQPRSLVIVADDIKDNPSLAQQAYTRLREQIIRGELPFGAVLSPRRLGREMGMSFLPVADALQRLEHEGLVETRNRAGSRVRVPTVEDVRSAFDLREALESQVARLCCERATKEERRQLKRMAREVDGRYAACEKAAANREQWLETNALHTEFHCLLARAAHSPRLYQEIERSQVLTLKVQFDNSLKAKKRPPDWHKTLVAGVLDADPATADAAARDHLRYGILDVIEAVERIVVELRWRA